MPVRLYVGSGFMPYREVLKFSAIFEEGPHSHFALVPTNYVADPALIQWSWKLSLLVVGAQRNRQRCLLQHPVPTPWTSSDVGKTKVRDVS